MTPAAATRVAVRGLLSHKLRSALTMMGIVIGIAAVIVMVSMGNAAQEQITHQIQNLGSNLLLVTPGNVKSAGVNLGEGAAATLNYGDARAVAAEAPAVAAVSPVVTTRATASYLNQNTVTTINGVVPAFLPVRNFQVDQGRFLGQDDVDNATKVAVLGASVERTLFNGAGPMLGASIRINQQSFQVIGVLAAKGGSGFLNQDDQVFIPLTTAQRRLFRTPLSSINQMVLQATDSSTMDQAASQARAVLRERHHLPASRADDFTIESQHDVLNTASTLTGIMTIFLGTIASISLLVGGIGIMNIMLVSVTERTREIGIRKAVGAKRRDILAQFVAEAVALCVLGGAGGIIIGVGICQIIGRLSIGDLSLAPIISPSSVAMALGVSLAIGLFFGIYPARHASRLHPIEALRYE